MDSYYKQGASYRVDPTRSMARFHVHVMGVPVLGGTLPIDGGELVIDADGGIRTANFQLAATGLPFAPVVEGRGPQDPFGRDGRGLIEFETQWARAAGPAHHELDGVLRLHGQERMLTLRAERGTWLEVGERIHWYRGVVRGGLDRRAWEVRSSTLTDAALLLLGHDVHFEVTLWAGPRAEAEPGDGGPSRGIGRRSYGRGATLVHPIDAVAAHGQ
jgi:hypothetical protein